MLDMQVSLAICVMLISVTIVFEHVKHKLEKDVPPMMASILQAMFGELTVLGFIALFAYFMLRLGVLSWLSTFIYGEDSHLIHLFEDIHFLLFVSARTRARALPPLPAPHQHHHECSFPPTPPRPPPPRIPHETRTPP